MKKESKKSENGEKWYSMDDIKEIVENYEKNIFNIIDLIRKMDEKIVDIANSMPLELRMEVISLRSSPILAEIIRSEKIFDIDTRLKDISIAYHWLISSTPKPQLVEDWKRRRTQESTEEDKKIVFEEKNLLFSIISKYIEQLKNKLNKLNIIMDSIKNQEILDKLNQLDEDIKDLEEKLKNITP